MFIELNQYLLFTLLLTAAHLLLCNFFSGKARDTADITYKNPLGLMQVSEMLFSSYC